MSGESYCLIWCDRARYVAQGTPQEIGRKCLESEVFVACIGLDGDEYALAIDKISSIIPITPDEARAVQTRGARR